MTIETPPLPLPLKGLLFIHFGSYFVELKYLKQDATQEEVEVQWAEAQSANVQKYVKTGHDLRQKHAQSRLCVHTARSFLAKNLRK